MVVEDPEPEDARGSGRKVAATAPGCVHPLHEEPQPERLQDISTTTADLHEIRRNGRHSGATRTSVEFFRICLFYAPRWLRVEGDQLPACREKRRPLRSRPY